METTAYFDNIQQEIAKRLNAATEEIVVAVARFDDATLFDLLCKQAGRGRTVRLATALESGGAPFGRLNLQRLRDIGGEVSLLPTAGDGAPAIEHNFCVIDGACVIAGSYNWTGPSADNAERMIVVITKSPPDALDGEEDLGADIAADYLDAFDGLLRDHGLGPGSIDLAEVQRRLEVIRNLLALEDWDALAVQLDRLKPARRAFNLDPLFAALRDPHDAGTAAWIDDYLRGSAGHALAKTERTALLRLELRALDYQITALRDEQAEIERQIHAFSLRAHRELGDLTARYLELDAERLRRLAERDPTLQAQAERAAADYRDHCEENARARAAPPLKPLDPEGLRALKQLYREASQRCHPDRVADVDQTRATELFVRLQAAYRNNDLEAVRAIHTQLREGRLFADQGTVLSDADALRHAIIILRHDLDQLAAELQALCATETYRTLKAHADWDAYFDAQRLALADAVLRLEEDLARIGAQIADPVDGETDARDRFLHLLSGRPDILIAGCSAHGALGFELLRRFPRHWDWHTLSGNRALRWSPSLVAYFADRWDWSILSANPALPWSVELIERFEPRWDWEALSDNTALPWGLDLLERFAGRWTASAARHVPGLLRGLSQEEIGGLMAKTPIPPTGDARAAEDLSDNDAESHAGSDSRTPANPPQAQPPSIGPSFDDDIPF